MLYAVHSRLQLQQGAWPGADGGVSARAGCVWWSARLVSACKGLRSFDGLEVEEWEKNVKIPDHHLQLEKKASNHTCRACTCPHLVLLPSQADERPIHAACRSCRRGTRPWRRSAGGPSCSRRTARWRRPSSSSSWPRSGCRSSTGEGPRRGGGGAKGRRSDRDPGRSHPRQTRTPVGPAQPV